MGLRPTEGRAGRPQGVGVRLVGCVRVTAETAAVQPGIADMQRQWRCVSKEWRSPGVTWHMGEHKMKKRLRPVIGSAQRVQIEGGTL
jgi:hypothetical protein